MENNNYEFLKSGTDIRGIAVKTPDAEVELTNEAVYDLVCAFLKLVSKRLNKTSLKIAVGNDVRISCERILVAVRKAVLESGCDLVYCGVCSTPSMFMVLKNGDWACDASIMITASHLPYEKNGLKFFTGEGGLESEDIDSIIELAQKGEKISSGHEGEYEEKSFMDDYCQALVEMVREACGKTQPLFGTKVIVDAGNGVGGFFTDKVLIPLGANTDGSQFLRYDGLFPNHIPNPEDKEAVGSLSKAVIRSGADLGVIFDTDVDRAAIVESDGSEINRNRLIALTAATLLQEKSGTIVTDSVTSDGLTEFIEYLGGKHVRFKRGYKNVIDEAIRREKEGEYCPLAMETSGHAAFKDNYFLDDGAYLVCRLLITLAKQREKGENLTSLISTLAPPAEENEVRIRFNEKSVNFKREGERVIEEIRHFAALDKTAKLAPVNYEGARVNFGENEGDGWTLVRMSVHDPVIPVNFESMTNGGNKIMAKKLYFMLKKFPFLDVSPLEKFIWD